MRPASFVLSTGLACLAANTAAACPVCFSGAGENREAFFWTFVLMTSLPLAFMGVTVWWLVRRARAQAASSPP